MTARMAADILAENPQEKKILTGALLAHLRAVAARSGLRIDAEAYAPEQDLWIVTAIVCDIFAIPSPSPKP